MKIQFRPGYFFRLIKNNYQLNYKKDLLFIGGLIALAGLYIGIFRFSEDKIHLENVIILLFFAFCILLGAYISMVFGDFSSGKKTRQLLLLPATHAEIFWSKFLISCIIFPVFFCLFSALVLKLCINYNIWLGNYQGKDYYSEFSTLRELWSCRFVYKTLPVFIYISIVVASCFLYGRMVFRKYAFIKTLVSWFLFFISLWLFTMLVYFLISGNLTPYSIPFFVIEYNKVPAPFIEWYPDLIKYVSVFFSISLIIISRIKFNEKTI